MTVFLSLYIHKAIKKGDQTHVKRWLQENPTKVNEYRGGSANHQHFAVANGTALHWAVYYGQLEITQLLLDKGAGISNCYVQSTPVTSKYQILKLSFAATLT